jgi:hypothetical protein
MRSRNSWIVMAVAALVAAPLLIVYASRGERMAAMPAAAGGTGATTQAKSTPPPPEPEKPAPVAPVAPTAAPLTEPVPLPPAPAPEPGASAPAGGAQNVLYDLNKLPRPVQRMLEQIVVAAQSGDIEQMRPVLETNELKPMVAAAAVDDPIAFWKKTSADGQGRDVLATLLNVLSAGFVRVKDGKEDMYIWPYFAETDLSKLSPAQLVELYRVLPASQAVPMQRAGKYSYYRVGIAADGVWHYFLQ